MALVPGVSLRAQVIKPQANRISAEPDLKRLVQVTTLAPAWVKAATDQGPVAPSTVVRLTFVLARAPEVEKAFQQLLADQQNPASPRFHQWMTPQQIGSKYGVTAHDLQVLTGWAASQGMVLKEVASSGTFVTVEAPAATMESALHTRFHAYAPAIAGETQRVAAAVAPSLPAPLLAIVRSISGLYDAPLRPLHAVRTVAIRPRISGSPVMPLATEGNGIHLLSPSDFDVIYGIFGAAGAGIDGTGQRIAILGESRVQATDITAFESLAHVPLRQPMVVVPTGGVDPGMTGDGFQAEATLDVDRALSTAPGANVDLVVSTSASGGLQTAAQYEVQTLLDPVMSISFGGCELNSGPGDVSYWDTLFSQAAAEGISTLVASGDSGAACANGSGLPTSTQVRSINELCSSASVTCVGGTEFADFYNFYGWEDTNEADGRSVSGYINEGAWNEPTVTDATGLTTPQLAATGGGASLYITKPSWQRGLGVPADGYRDVPDVSFASSGHDGYVSCLAIAGSDCVTSVSVFAGTSAATPSMAAIAALLNQKLGSSQGNLNPLLYRVAENRLRNDILPNGFHDVTPATSGVALCELTVPSMCNNSTPGPTGLSGGLAGYPVTEGYDLATGLGSLNVTDFLNAAGMVPVLAPTGTYLTLSPDIVESTVPRDLINTSRTVIFGASVGGNGMESLTGEVQFLANGIPLGEPVAVDALGFATTPAERFPAAGTYAISAQYLGSSDFATSTSQTVTLQVTAAPTATTTTTLSLGSATGVLGGTTALRASVAANDGSMTAPEGTVQFFSNGVAVGASPLTDGGTYSTALSLLPAGTNSITAVFLGNQSYLGSSSAPQTFTVSKALTTMQLGSSFSTVAAGAIDQYTASVSSFGYSQLLPTGTVEFFRDGVSFDSVALMKGQAVSAWQTYPGAEMLGVTATYSGDTNYMPTSSGVAPVTVVGGAPYTVSATTVAMQLYAGEGAPGSVLTVNVAQTVNFTGNVNLTCTVQYKGTGTAANPPTCNVSSTFIPFPLAYGVSSMITIGTSAPHTIAGAHRGTGRPGPAIALCSIVFGLLAMGRLRWRRGGLRSLVALMLLIVAIGCGSGGGGATGGGGGSAPAMTGGTTPGSYAVVITPTNTAGLADPPPITIALSVQ